MARTGLGLGLKRWFTVGAIMEALDPEVAVSSESVLENRRCVLEVDKAPISGPPHRTRPGSVRCELVHRRTNRRGNRAVKRRRTPSLVFLPSNE